MKQEYIQKLKDIKLQITEPDKTSNEHQDIICLICDNVFNATPKSKLNHYNKSKRMGCSSCTQKDRYLIINKLRVHKLNKKFEFITNLPEQIKNTDFLIVKNRNCNHIFESKVGNLLFRNVQCPICNVEIKRQRCNKNNIIKAEKSEIYKHDYKLYKHIVYRMTRQTYRKYKSIINPQNLPRCRHKGYQLDHIIPVMYCFKNRIPPELCSHRDNLRIIPWIENAQKYDKLILENIPNIFEGYF